MKKGILTLKEQISVLVLNAGTVLWSSCSMCFQD